MKYWIDEVSDNGNVFYTYQLLKKLAVDNGHALVAAADEADVILVSLVSVRDIKRLRRLRMAWPNARIVAGGAVSFMTGPISIWADAINVGQWFEFFKLKTWRDILAAPFVYTRDKGIVYPSTLVEWAKAPMIQTAALKWYYWAGVGCKNKCAFCFTSWTNPEDENTGDRVRRAWVTLREAAPRANLILIANETQKFDLKNKVRDFMVKDYIKPIQVPSGLIRLGIEFPTEATRRAVGKPISDADIVTAFELARGRRNDLHCFYIAGLNTMDEWMDHFYTVLLPTSEKQPKIMIKITNLMIEPHTPLYRKRKEIDFGNLMTDAFRKKLMAAMVENNRKRFAFPVLAPRKALAETYYSWMTSAEEYDAIAAFERDPAGPIEPMIDWAWKAGMYDKEWPDEVRLWWRERRDSAKGGRSKDAKD